MKEYKEIGSFKSMEMTFTIEDADLDKLHDVLKDINVRECPWFEVQDKHGNKAKYYREPQWIPCSERGINIDETIKTYEELSKTASGIDDDSYQHYAVEYKQVADWLKELKRYKELFEPPEEAEECLNEFMV